VKRRGSDRDLLSELDDPVGGIEKKSVAFAACLYKTMKSLSCHIGMPECWAALTVRRPRKNEVVMMSHFKPAALRKVASAAGMRGLSI